MARQADAIDDALAVQPVTRLDRDPLAVRQDVLRAELVRTGQAVALNLIAAEAIGGVGDERRRGDIAPAILGLAAGERALVARSEEHTPELPSLMRISYAVFCLKKKITQKIHSMNYMNTTQSQLKSAQY